MKLSSKRFCSAFIDYFIIGAILVVCGISNLPGWVWRFEFKINDFLPVSLPSFGFIMILIPLLLKDLLFRNSSLGKKIMGLVILSEDNSVPSVKTMIKRDFVMSVFGFIIYFKCIIASDYSAFADWELEHLGTKVAEKKFLQK